MLAAIIVGTITIGVFLVFVLYKFIKKAVVSGTQEALEIYFKKQDVNYEPNMIEIGEALHQARKKQIALEKVRAKKAEKEQKILAKLHKKQARVTKK